MVLVVENGSGLPNADAYISVATFDAYHIANTRDPSALVGKLAAQTLEVQDQPGDGDTFTIGHQSATKVYTLQTTLTDVDGNIQIGASVAATRQNILKAINLSGTAGADYAASMTEHPAVEALNVEASIIFLRSEVYGDVGNTFATTETFTSADNTFGGATMAGGSDPTYTEADKEGAIRRSTRYLDLVYEVMMQGTRKLETQALALPRDGMVTISGHDISADSVPQRAQDACASAALKALTEDLLPDLAVSTGPLTAKTIKVGSITTAKQFQSGTREAKRFTLIDRLMEELLHPLGSFERA